MKEYIEKIPDECPRCHTELAPDLEEDWEIDVESIKSGYLAVLHCPDCGHEIPWRFMTEAEADDWA